MPETPQERQERMVGLVRQCWCGGYHTGCGHGMGPEHCGACMGMPSTTLGSAKRDE